MGVIPMPIYGKVVRKVLKKAAQGDWLEGLVRKVRFGRAKEWKLIVRARWPDQKTLKDMINFILRSKVISPNYLAEKYKIKVSTCKRILERLEKLGFVKKLESAAPGALLYEPVRRT